MKTADIKTIDGRGLNDLLRLVKRNTDSEHAEVHQKLVRRAFQFAKQAHGEQKRKSGDPYIVHPLAAAITLAELGLDHKTIAAALLHDVPEDTTTTLHDVRKEFGKEIAFLVEGITKLGQLKYRGVDRYVENLRRMFIAMAKDVRVILIKFADRINNLQTLDSLPPEKRRRIALESMEIYAPIANRLGMGEMKGMLEDLSFPYVYPEEYKWMTRKVIPEFEEKQQFVKKFQKYIQREFQKRDVEIISMHGRAKHVYSLYRKLIKHGRDINKIYDLVALRIIVENIGTCYEVLGVIHEIAKPLKGRIKDYIAQPKPNGYQSLHTTVFSPDKFAKDEVHGEIVEIQIRTPKMHAEAEYGIAAHWQYKEEKLPRSKMNKKLDWMRELLDRQSGIEDQKQLLDSLKLDVFRSTIFVFTPRGDVIELPEDSTPIDFAYQIHTDLGHKCSGVKINEQIGSLNAKLKSGDVVELFSDPNRKGPSEEWLDSVKTTTARKHIKEYISKRKKQFLDEH